MEHDLGQLVRAAQSGDTRAWETLVARFSNMVWATARAHRLSPADAEDVYSTTWLRLAEHLDRIREPERLGGWLAATARNECLRLLRHGARETAVDETGVADSPDGAPLPGDQLVAAERDGILWRAFARIDERCQRLLRVLMADPRPAYEDVSEALGMPVGSIGPTYGRCLEKLRTQAEGLGLGPA